MPPRTSKYNPESNPAYKGLRWIGILVWVFIAPGQSESKPGLTGVEVNAEEFEIVEGGDVMMAIGNVAARKGDTIIRADRVVIWQGDSEIYAEGNVSLTESGTLSYADKLLFNWEVHKGLAFNTELHKVRPGRQVNWHMKSDKAEQQGPDVFKAKRAKITTCNFKEPHQHFSASSVVFKDQNSVAFKNAVFHVHKIPVFYMPYSYRDLQYPWPWFHFGFGSSSEFGTFFKTDLAMEVYPGVRLLLDLDHYTDRGTGTGINVEYESSRRVGYLDTYFIKDGGQDFAGVPLEEDDRYRIKLLHRELLTDTSYDALLDHEDEFFIGRWTVDLELQDFSDNNFYNEFFKYESQYHKEPENQLFVHGNWENSSLSFLGHLRVNEFPNLSQSEQRSSSTNAPGQTEYLPRIAYDLLSQPIWENRLLFTFGAEFARVRRRFDEDLNLTGADLFSDFRSIDRLDFDTELSAPLRLNFLHVEPFVFTRETFFSESLQQTSSDWRTAYGAGLRLSSEFWRLFEIESKWWQIDHLMHRITPEVTFRSVQGVDNPSESLIFFDEVDSLEPVDKVTLGLFNVLETKRGGAIYRLLEFDVLTNYFPNNRRDNNNNSFSDVETDLRWYVHPNLSLYNDNEIGTDPVQFKIMNVGMNFSPVTELDLGLHHRFSRDDSNRTIWSARFTPSDRWEFNLRQDYEWNRKEYFDFQISLRRILHDWIVEFGFDEDFGRNDRTFFFTIGPKAGLMGKNSKSLRRNLF